MQSRPVVYAGPFSCSRPSAGTIRVHGIAQSMTSAGRDVLLLSGGDPSGVQGELPGQVRWQGTGELAGSRFARAWAMTATWGQRTIRALEALPALPSHVIVYGGLLPYAHHLRGWCRRTGVALLVDIVEWYEPDQWAGGRLGPYYWSSQAALRFAYPRAAGAICISPALAARFPGLLTTVVPPTRDVISTPWSTEPPKTPTLVYAGNPGGKEPLAPVIAAWSAARTQGADWHLRILGPSRAALERQLGTLPSSIDVPGWCSPADTQATVAAATFSLIVRPPRTANLYGFPTKATESMALGTPVLATSVGALATYLRPTNSVIVAGTSPALLTSALLTAWQRRADPTLRAGARETAETSFDFRRYVAPLTALLNQTETAR